MKKITLLIFCLFMAPWIFAQQVLTYNFEYSLAEEYGLGPELTVLGIPGTYLTDTLNEISGATKTVYRFEDNNGVQFNNTASGNFIGESYTIELYFVFDELTSWKRVTDWKNRKTDWGAYVYYGQINFYNILYSEEAPVEAGEYTYYVITRDGTTNQVLIYTDAEVKITFDDAAGNALIDEDGVLNFFFDDLVVQNESSPGAVAMLKLYNYVLVQDSITKNWNSIGSQVFGMNDIQRNIKQTKVYPNPVNDILHVDISSFNPGEEVVISLINSEGHIVRNTSVKASDFQAIIDTSSLPSGLYMLRTTQGNQSNSTKVLIR
jgi:OmpA-OmpF porin, OOP family